MYLFIIYKASVLMVYFYSLGSLNFLWMITVRFVFVSGEFLFLIHKFVPVECYITPPSLPNLISYAIRGCPLRPYFATNSEDAFPLSPELNKQYSPNCSYSSGSFHSADGSIEKFRSVDDFKSPDAKLLLPDLNAQDYAAKSTVNNYAVASNNGKTAPNGTNDKS